MYIKTSCAHCGENTSHNLTIYTIETETGPVLEIIEVTDTISEEELIKLISNFIFKTQKNGIKATDLSKFLTEAFGISPQFVPEIEGKIQFMKECK
jgi:hypothetical protein